MPWLLNVWMLSMRDFLRTNHIAQRDSRWSQMMPAQRPQIAVNKHQPVLSYFQPQKTHPVERATHRPNQSSSLPFYVFSHGLQGETPPWPAAQACHLTWSCTKIVLVFAPRISLTFGVEHADIRHLERFHANQTMSAVSSVQELAASEGFVTSQQSEMWHKISIQIVFKQSFPNNFFFCEAIFVAGQTRHLGPCRQFLFRPTVGPVLDLALTWPDRYDPSTNEPYEEQPLVEAVMFDVGWKPWETPWCCWEIVGSYERNQCG